MQYRPGGSVAPGQADGDARVAACAEHLCVAARLDGPGRQVPRSGSGGLKEQRAFDPPSLGVSMLHVMHDVGDGRLLVRFEGSLDERATDSVLSAVALTPVALPVMLDLSRTTSIIDCALARLSKVLKSRNVRFRGLRLYHERL